VDRHHLTIRTLACVDVAVDKDALVDARACNHNPKNR
jgi:hypothetical protein